MNPGAFVNPYPYGDRRSTGETAIEKYELEHLLELQTHQFIPQLSRLDRDIRIGLWRKPKKCSGDISILSARVSANPSSLGG
jgi:hypothetical protein